MSKNFELLTQVDKNQQLFGVADRMSPPVVIELAEAKLGESTAKAVAKPAEPKLGELAREEVAKLAQRVFQPPRDGVAPMAVMFCGIEHGDGASWISAQVARMVAAQGTSTVCAVDANLRSPALHSYFGLANRRGLADAVRQAGPIRNFLEQGTSANLWVLPAGVDADPCLMLASERFRERITELRAEFDYLIFDVPPVGHSSDAIMLGRMLDGVVIVVGAHSTRRETARKAKENLEAAQVRLLGTVLNKRTFPIPEPLYRRL